MSSISNIEIPQNISAVSIQQTVEEAPGGRQSVEIVRSWFQSAPPVHFHHHNAGRIAHLLRGINFPRNRESIRKCPSEFLVEHSDHHNSRLRRSRPDNSSRSYNNLRFHVGGGGHARTAHPHHRFTVCHLVPEEHTDGDTECYRTCRRLVESQHDSCTETDPESFETGKIRDCEYIFKQCTVCCCCCTSLVIFWRVNRAKLR